MKVHHSHGNPGSPIGVNAFETLSQACNPVSFVHGSLSEMKVHVIVRFCGPQPRKKRITSADPQGRKESHLGIVDVAIPCVVLQRLMGKAEPRVAGEQMQDSSAGQAAAIDVEELQISAAPHHQHEVLLSQRVAAPAPCLLPPRESFTTQQAPTRASLCGRAQ